MKTKFSLLTLAALCAASSAFAVKPSEPPTGTTSTDWSLAGNAGTNAATNFLGTTDAQPLEVRVNNTRALRLEGSVTNPTQVNVIVGSSHNQILGTSFASTIAGGGADEYDGFQYGNSIEGSFATIGGGGGNIITGHASGAVIAGGERNTIQLKGYDAVIAGGYGNEIGPDSYATTIAGGLHNSADGAWAFVAGGRENVAGGHNSFAGGYRAHAMHTGSFVWSDASTDLPYNLTSTNYNQFLVRAAGGVHLDVNTNINFGAQVRQMINLWKKEYGIGVQTSTQYFRTAGTFAWYQGGVHNDGYINAGGGNTLMLLNTGGLTVNGTFISKSDRNAKENFATVDPQDVLTKVLALPVSRWNYKDDDAKSVHVGPMAQDFYAAFKLGADDKHIATVDADGVALAAIQGLHAQLKERDARINALAERLASVEALLKNVATK